MLNLAVLPEARRQGVGSQLLHSALLQASARGAQRIFLEVRDSNQPALLLYQRWGFLRAGSRPGYYTHPPADGLLLVRSLRQPVTSSR